MCGIGFWLTDNTKIEWGPLASPTEVCFDASGYFERHLRGYLRQRGPDQIKVRHFSDVSMMTSVLSLRGHNITHQPYCLGGDRVLAFNGENFTDDAEELLGGVSDTEFLGECIHHILDEEDNADDEIVHLLDTIEGPFAFCVLDSKKKSILFGRDKWGRRSLVYGYSKSSGLVVASVAGGGMNGSIGNGWQEVPVDGVYRCDLQTGKISMIPWPTPPTFSVLSKQNFFPLDASNISTSPQEGVKIVYNALEASVRVRVQAARQKNLPVGVLFSGGLDSTVLAGLAAKILVENNNQARVIELINVSFLKDGEESGAKETAPDRYTALQSYLELCKTYGVDMFRFIAVDVPFSDVKQSESRIMSLVCPRSSHMDFNIGSALWFGARGDGMLLSHAECVELLENLPVPSDVDAKEKKAPKKANERVIDVSKLEMVKCKYCPAQAKPDCIHGACRLCCRYLRQRAASSNDDQNDESTQRLSNRAKVLMNVDVSTLHTICPIHTDTKDQKKNSKNKAENKIVDNANISSAPAVNMMMFGSKYECQNRILLVGVGADEVFGGYARYFTRKSHDGLEGLRDEMVMDLRRLWERNLGRDDRVLSDHGREARHPFLDERLLAACSNLPIALIAAANKENDLYSLPTYDKWLLRAVAVELGLHFAAKFKKRAIQFGTRIAKNINVSLHGSNRKGKGTMIYQTENVIDNIIAAPSIIISTV